MTEKLTFDQQAARRLESAYKTPEIVEQRRIVVDELSLEFDESVLDIGVGPGLLAFELAGEVGIDGTLLGIDTSEAMLEMARKRCKALPQARFEIADACSLPCGDAEMDAAAVTQVYEYVQDIPKALAELHRVLKPGARAIIVDSDYDSLVLNTEKPELTGRILDAWDDHFAHRDLPRKLAGHLKRAGFKTSLCRAIPLLNTGYLAHEFSFSLVKLIASFAVGRRGLTEADSKEWLAELDDLALRGEYFFSLNRYLFLARKPF